MNNNNNDEIEFCEVNYGNDILAISNEFITNLLPKYLLNLTGIANFRIIKLENINTHIKYII